MCQSSTSRILGEPSLLIRGFFAHPSVSGERLAWNPAATTGLTHSWDKKGRNFRGLKNEGQRVHIQATRVGRNCARLLPYIDESGFAAPPLIRSDGATLRPPISPRRWWRTFRRNRIRLPGPASTPDRCSRAPWDRASTAAGAGPSARSARISRRCFQTKSAT